MTRLLLTLVTVASLGLTSGCGGTDEETSAEPSPGATVTVTATPDELLDADVTQTPSPEAATPKSTPKPRGPEPVDLSGYDLPGLTTPSGNIGCLFDDGQGAHVRCDRREMAGVPGGKPADCDFDWGHSVELSVGRRGALACTSDTVMGQPGETDGSRELPYGDSVRYRGITCTSTKQGLRCSTQGGHGFLISRATIRVS